MSDDFEHTGEMTIRFGRQKYVVEMADKNGETVTMEVEGDGDEPRIQVGQKLQIDILGSMFEYTVTKVSDEKS